MNNYTLLDPDEMAIIRGLEMQPPEPKSVQNISSQYGTTTKCECPDCGIFCRPVGYNTHWVKAHKQKYQLQYFKEWKNATNP